VQALLEQQLQSCRLHELALLDLHLCRLRHHGLLQELLLHQLLLRLLRAQYWWSVAELLALLHVVSVSQSTRSVFKNLLLSDVQCTVSQINEAAEIA
jgi:hypothetical protein